ncbi:ABC transporter permease [Salinirussus salinus]|jgi:NitT/TauT family transport system permease protein|uniref:ABC transporter permease n=1 Tax=Salinirussus salinus TaxID=1198300 RepID=UPI00135872B4|nr:ABC transporter permease [Salinirussus salinus]
MASSTDTETDTDVGGLGYPASGRFGLEDWRTLALQLGALAAFVFVWWGAALLTPRTLLPRPPAVAAVLVSDLASGLVFELTVQSLRHYIPGLFVGSALGMAVGITVGWSKTAENTVGTVASVLRPVPPLAWIPFAIIWFGLNDQGAAFIIAIVAFWINYYNAEGGVNSVDDQLLEVAQSLGTKSDLGLVRKVVVPSAMPELFTGFRTAAGQAWMVVVAAELLGVPGIGQHLWDAANFLRMEVVIAYMLVIGVLFLLSDRAIKTVERRALAWR